MQQVLQGFSCSSNNSHVLEIEDPNSEHHHCLEYQLTRVTKHNYADNDDATATTEDLDDDFSESDASVLRVQNI